MARLIDADSMIQSIENNEYYTDKLKRVMSGIVDSRPAVDTVEVRHGRWIDKPLDEFRKWESTCSVCGWSGVSDYDSYVDIFDFDFCPHCGAKMDEEE